MVFLRWRQTREKWTLFSHVLQQHVQEENVVAEQNLSNQERNSSVDQEDPEPPQMKEEQEEVCIIQEGMQLACEFNCEEISREIFGVFDKPLGQLDGEISYERRLLDAIWKPRVVLHRIDHPQQCVCKEGKGLTNRQLCDQEKNFSQDHEDPDPPQINEEQEEPCISQHGKQIVLKQVTDTFLLTSTDKDSDHSEVEPNSDQLISDSLPVDESPYEDRSQHVDSGSTRNAALKPKKNHNKKSSHSNNVDKSSLSGIHHDTDAGRKSLKCDVCGKTFENKRKLKKHHYIHKSVKPFACNTCGKGFSFRSKLEIHMRSHTGERLFSCKACGKRFSQSNTLTRHMRIHTDERPYSCETCGKCFSQSNNLTAHMRTHTGEKPFSCERCRRRFRHPGQLHVHMRTHTGERPYFCETCGKRFSQSSTLTEHMRTHTGEKPYFCGTCGKIFSRSSNLIAHMRTHTGERPFSCERCRRRFRHPGQLRVHMRTHTAERL